MNKFYTFLILMVSTFSTYSQSGVLDTSFGNNGIVSTVINGSYNLAQTSVVQPDGKIIVAGEAGEPSPMKLAVARYNADGSLDSSFGNSGTLLIQVGPAKSYARNIAVQADGKILIGAYTYDDVAADFAIVRLNENGALDNSFGNNGITIVDNGSHEIVDAMTILNDGKILLAGNNYNDFLSARFNTDGSLDVSYGANGWIATGFDSSDSQVKDAALQADGKFLLGGYSYNNSTGVNSMAVARYNEDGSMDTTFGTAGKVNINSGNNEDYAAAIAIQSDGKILIGGYTYVGDNPLRYDLVAVRLNTDGSLDANYGNNGIAISRAIENGQNYAEQMLLQPDNKLIIAGYASITDNYNLAMVRFDSNGNVDTTFGTEGKVSTDINGRSDFGKTITIQPDNKIILSGYSYTNAGVAEIIVARYDNIILGTNDYRDLEFQLYPNPASEQVTIQLSDVSSNYQLEIFNVLGQKVFTSEIQGIRNINVSDWASGTYLIKLNSENNSRVVRFIKK